MAKKKSTTADQTKNTKRNCYRIFLSHKQSGHDISTARSFKNIMHSLYGEAVDVFVAELIDSASKWDEQIFENLKNADEFVLLYSDNQLRWDWPMFEAGCFRAFSSEKDEATVAIIRHHKVTPPNMFYDVQHVQIDPRIGVRDRDSQPKKYLRELDQRIKTKIGKLVNKKNAAELRRRLSKQIVASVSLSSDQDTIEDLELGFEVTMRPNQSSQKGEDIQTFYPQDVLTNAAWNMRFGAKQEHCEWEQFLENSAAVISLRDDTDHLDLRDYLNLWTMMQHKGIKQKLRSPSVKLFNSSEVCKLSVIRSRRLLDGCYRLSILVVSNPLPFTAGINEEEILTAELFMALGRCLRSEAILPLLEFSKQFEGRRRVPTLQIEEFFRIASTQLSTVFSDFRLRGYSRTKTLELESLIQAKPEIVEVFRRVDSFWEELDRIRNQREFKNDKLAWLLVELQALQDANFRLLEYSAVAVAAAIRKSSSGEVVSYSFDESSEKLRKTPWWKLEFPKRRKRATLTTRK